MAGLGADRTQPLLGESYKVILGPMQPAEFEDQQARPIAAGQGVLLQQPTFLELTQQP